MNSHETASPQKRQIKKKTPTASSPVKAKKLTSANIPPPDAQPAAAVCEIKSHCKIVGV